MIIIFCYPTKFHEYFIFINQGRSNHIRTYARAYLKKSKEYLLFIYLFVHRFIGRKRL